MVTTDYRLLIPLLVTALTPAAIILLRGDQNRREAASLVSGLLAFASVVWIAQDVLAGQVLRCTLVTLYPGISLTLQADGLSMLFALIASFLWMPATFYNMGYMRGLNEHAQTRYYLCFAASIFGALGVAFAGNVFTLYLFYEVITVFTYPLVAHHQDEEGYAGAAKYLVYLMGSSKLFLLPAMILTYVLTGTLEMTGGDVMAGIFPAEVVAAHPLLVQLTWWLYLFGLAKAAIFPLHNWLPSAMVAPTPVSALLHAVAVVKAGVFSVVRVMVSVFGVQTMQDVGVAEPTMWLAAFTILGASAIALTKDDLKARLAYSTVSQLSYVILGAAMLAPLGVTGGMMHIVHHAFSKITLFFAAGAIYVAAHSKKISEMGGLGRKMPFTFGAFAIASLSMIGVPPACGFTTKWLLLGGALDPGPFGGGRLLLFVLFASTLLNAAYFLPVTLTAFCKPAGPVADHAHGEADARMVVPLCLTAAVSIGLGLYPEFFLGFVQVMTGGAK